MKKIIAAAMACMFVLVAVSAGASGLGNSTGSSEAQVAFLDGLVELIVIGDPSEPGTMSIDFGTHELPLQNVTYFTENGPHKVMVSHGRVNPITWNVSAKLSAFSNTATPTPGTFDGIITLANGVATATRETAAAADISVNSSVALTSEGSAELVFTNTDTLPRDFYTVTWANPTDAQFTFASGVDYYALTVDTYTADVTWTLAVDGGATT